MTAAVANESGCRLSEVLIARRAISGQPYDAVVARFEQVKETFWSDSAVGVQPPLTDEMVVDAESILGVCLPSALLELLRVQNGGGVADGWNAFPTTQPTSWSDSHVPFDTMAGIGAAEGALSLLDTPYLVQEWNLPSPLVLLTGDGHWWIALDYRECGPDGEPSVTWFDTELDQDLRLTPDFRTFIEALTCEPDDDVAP